MSTCRSCGAAIKWIELTSSKKHPVDLELVSTDDLSDGDKLVTEDGEIIVVRDFMAHDEGGMGYLSHFSTCPDANKWGKK